MKKNFYSFLATIQHLCILYISVKHQLNSYLNSGVDIDKSGKFTEKVKKQVDAEIIKPTLKAMFDKGHPFKGILYAGLMIENEKAKLVEYNIRFGDPECQVLMMRLKDDLLDLIISSFSFIFSLCKP